MEPLPSPVVMVPPEVTHRLVTAVAKSSPQTREEAWPQSEQERGGVTITLCPPRPLQSGLPATWPCLSAPRPSVHGHQVVKYTQHVIQSQPLRGAAQHMLSTHNVWLAPGPRACHHRQETRPTQQSLAPLPPPAPPVLSARVTLGSP